MLGPSDGPSLSGNSDMHAEGRWVSRIAAAADRDDFRRPVEAVLGGG